MSDAKLLGEADPSVLVASGQVEAQIDVDPAETSEWLGSLDYVYKSKRRDGVVIPSETTTPYVNSIPLVSQPAYPGNREIERRIKSIIRWNAMAMVVRANKKNKGQGGHISTFASSATLYEVAFNHFFKGRGESGYAGDLVYFQGHASPGMWTEGLGVSR